MGPKTGVATGASLVSRGTIDDVASGRAVAGDPARGTIDSVSALEQGWKISAELSDKSQANNLHACGDMNTYYIYFCRESSQKQMNECKWR